MSHQNVERGEFESRRETDDELAMFDLAPVSLWLEDYSELKVLFTELRTAGIADLRSWLFEDPARISACSRCIRVVKVNRKTLTLFEAENLEHLIENIGRIFRGEMLDKHVEELVQLWDGRTQFSTHTVNYSLSGKRMDFQLNGIILPGHENDWSRVLIAIENVTERETAQLRLATSEAYARGLFEHSPVSLWVEDFSAVKRLLDAARAQGIGDFRIFTETHPEFVERCMEEIRVVNVNRHTLEMFRAPDKEILLHRLCDIFRDDMRQHFKEQLIELWQGKLFQQREVVNYALDGEMLYMNLQFSVLPGHEKDWSLALVALTDISARKKAEVYLEFLGKHDVLTKLHNRSYYVDELNRLERKGPLPVTVVVVDLNNLKTVNDQMGHAAGDGLLRRAGEVLAKAVDSPVHAARIGGDEFAILLPATDEYGGAMFVERIQKLIEINNQFYSSPELSVSIGTATSVPGERLEATVQRADVSMYADKRAYYSTVAEHNRRHCGDGPIEN